MKMLISGAAALLALAAMADAQAASRGSGCSVTHQDCYPACVQFKDTADGQDCARTKDVCRSICVPKPSYPGTSNTENVDIMRFETMKPMPDPDAQDQLYAPTPSPQ